MKRPISRGTVPIGGYCRYVDPDAGFTIAHPYWDFCKAKAKSERIARGLSIPYDWDAFFDEQFCKATPQACFEIPDAPVEKSPSWTSLALQFAGALVGWAKSGFKVVSWDGFKTRYAQCTGDANTPRCPHFTTFPHTGIVKCGRCGCSALKLWWANEKCPIGKW